MNKTLLLICGATLLAAPALADLSYTFSPSGMPDIDHGRAYRWGIDWIVPDGQYIVSASITYSGIYDWRYEPDHLYTNLLDSAPAGVQSYYDGSNWGNYFNGSGLLLGTWSDPYGDSQHAIDLSYAIPESHFGWLEDGNFGFGIDPDCHYYYDNIVVEVTTANVIPAPGAGLLGVIGLGFVSRMKRRVQAA